MPRPERDFKGIWIPKEIWLSRQLGLMEKVLFVEINSLDNERGCYASNRHFSDFFNVSTRQIATYIASLKEKGFITVTIQNQNERIVRAAGRYARVSDEQKQQLRSERQELIHRMTVNQGRGMKKSS